MELNHNEILDADLDEKTPFRRRKLLPWWIKTFTWIFLILGVVAVLGLIIGMAGMSFQLSIYGLETTNPISLMGLTLTSIFLYKGIVAFGLWTEKEWAISLGEIDAFTGILICAFIMIIYPFLDDVAGFTLSLRLDLILLIPYFIKLKNIKYEWEKGK